jgi:hypothetical protein
MRISYLIVLFVSIAPLLGCGSHVRADASPDAPSPVAPSSIGPGTVAGPNPANSGELARYQKFAGDPVEDFAMFDLFRWQVVGPQNLVAWSTIREAYLLKVDLPCTRLEWTNALGLTTMQKWKVSRTFDFVIFAEERCKILEIRPVNLAAMAKDAPPAKPEGKS